MRKQEHFEIAVDHPAFAGHFPGTPIVPGVVLLDAVIQVISRDSGLDATALQINAVKFTSPLKPGQSVVIAHELSADELIKFEVLDGSRQIVIGNITLKGQKSLV